MNTEFYIVTPCLNAKQYINETILSVVSQAGNFSIYYHIQDGGSTDGTIECLQSWENLLSKPSPLVSCKKVQFTWASEQDFGMYDAINKGFLKLSPPDFGIMAWVNADDPYLPRAFSTVCRFFETIPTAEWVGGKIMRLDEEGALAEVKGYDYYPQKAIRCGLAATSPWWCIQQNGCFWKASLWHKVGGLDTSLYYAGDALLWPRFSYYADFHHFSINIGLFRSTKDQLSRNKNYRVEIDNNRKYFDSFNIINLNSYKAHEYTPYIVNYHVVYKNKIYINKAINFFIKNIIKNTKEFCSLVKNTISIIYKKYLYF